MNAVTVLHVVLDTSALSTVKLVGTVPGTTDGGQQNARGGMKPESGEGGGAQLNFEAL
jgi:hypothetical protein